MTFRQQIFRLQRCVLLLVCIALATASIKEAAAQSITSPRNQTASPDPTPVTDMSADKTNITKKNGRPDKVTVASPLSSADYKPAYFFEFTRPGFIVSHILIEHDAQGKGKISFLKSDFEDMITDPIQLTSATQMRIDEALARLDFLNSKEDYQYERDLSNMGNINFRYVHDGHEREVRFNWTTNKDAKFLLDEYRRIGIEAVWKFDLAAVRINQPLSSPRLVEELDNYLKRDEITDPTHLLPILNELSNDERLPLITRNHATRIITRLTKGEK